MRINAVEEATEELGFGCVELKNVAADTENEVEGSDFGDRRLNRRYGQVMRKMMTMPQAPFSQSSECLSEMHAAYRFVSNNKVTVDKLLEPHRSKISHRAKGEKLVLAIQDTTRFDLSDHLSVDGLHPSTPGKISRALHVHST
jgi:hypothetical protein